VARGPGVVRARGRFSAGDGIESGAIQEASVFAFGRVYPGRIAELEAFLRKFPESRERARVEELLQALREEAAKVGQGMIRVGTGWFRLPV
jgi:hypothetical protein